MTQERIHSTHRVRFAANSTTSDRIDVRLGAFGLLVVPTGSDVVGKTIQVVATEGDDSAGVNAMPDADLLTTPKTATAGAMSFTSDEILQIAAAGFIKLKLNSAVTNASTIFLLWKS